jgi:hypothetical protein
MDDALKKYRVGQRVKLLSDIWDDGAGPAVPAAWLFST